MKRFAGLYGFEYMGMATDKKAAKAFEYDWYSDFCKSSVCAAVLKLVMNMI